MNCDQLCSTPLCMSKRCFQDLDGIGGMGGEDFFCGNGNMGMPGWTIRVVGCIQTKPTKTSIRGSGKAGSGLNPLWLFTDVYDTAKERSLV